MSEIKIFEHEQFGAVRTMNDEQGVPWFVGKDVAESLGYKNASKAVMAHVDEEDTLQLLVPTNSRFGNLMRSNKTTFINESGLYSLILSSKMPQAKEFKHWVTSEVLPRIRKTGGYIPVNEGDDEKEILERAVMILQRTLEDQAPKVLFADAIAGSSNAISIADLAKLLTQNGFPIGQHRLFQWMRDHGYLFQASTRPMQKWVEEGLFDTKVLLIHGSEYCVTKVTGKGQMYFINGFLSGRFH